MPALPPDSIAAAASRWLALLRTSNVPQAWAFIGSDSAYTDQTQTQYAAALDWLIEVSMIEQSGSALELSSDLKGLSSDTLQQIAFVRGIERARPAWLADSDVLIPDESELPEDAARLSAALGLAESKTFFAIREVHGKIDLKERSLIGASGEIALVELLESLRPGCTEHVALTDDGFGYDIVFRPDDLEFHIEVKSTTRKGRLTIYLSRHEHEVASSDPSWLLAVVGLHQDMSMGAVAFISYDLLIPRTPVDVSAQGIWQSVRHELTLADLRPGLECVTSQLCEADAVQWPPSVDPESFAWMPKS